ncbi:hypothetical protein DFH06DRAFT_1476326 [Mycena polygramma]|nr:hypothetical protein DFH06DRAFT_1476326 [Mycena polygramma]
MASPALGAPDTPSAVTCSACCDNSRSVSVLVDPTGTGKKCVAAKVTKSDNAHPRTDGTDVVTLSRPAGTQYTGGTDGNRCLLPASAAASSSRRPLLSSSAAGAAPAVSSSPTDVFPSASAAPRASTSGSSNKSKAQVPCTSSRKRRAVGSRAPRALRLAGSVSGYGSELEGLHPHPFFASTPLLSPGGVAGGRRASSMFGLRQT